MLAWFTKIFKAKANRGFKPAVTEDLGLAKAEHSLVPHKAENSNIDSMGGGKCGAVSTKRKNGMWWVWKTGKLHCQSQDSRVRALQQMWVFGVQNLD